jgi:hypothetical protein
VNSTAYLVALLAIDHTNGEIVCKGTDIFSEPRPSVFGLDRVTAVVTSSNGVDYADAKKNLLNYLKAWHPWLVPKDAR